MRMANARATRSNLKTTPPMEIMPKFSFVIPLYNREPYIAAAITSILGQEGDDFEIVVVDDGSTDGSLSVVEGFSDSRIRVIRNNHAGGPATRNSGISNARGELIIWVDSDDRYAKGALAALRQTISEYPEADVYYGDIEIFDDRAPGHIERTSYPDYYNEQLIPRLIRGNCLPNPGTAVRKSVYDHCGRYDEGFPRCHDFEMWTRMADGARFKKVPAVVCHWRRHAGGLSHTASRAFEAKVAARMVERYPPSRLFPDLEDNDAGLGLAHARVSEITEQLGEYAVALRLAYKAQELGALSHGRLESLERKAGTSHTPTFSVVVTTYNRPDLLRDALRSLERQSFRDFEVILVNDCGEDVGPLLAGYSYRLTYVRLARNLGPAAARNTAHRLAKGDYIVYLDDDDAYLPEHLQTLHAAVKGNPGKVVYSDAIFIGERIEDGVRTVVARDRRYAHSSYSHERLAVDNYIPVNTFAWPRALSGAVGDFDESLPGLEDWDFLLRLASHMDFFHVERETVEVRMRTSSEDLRRSEQARKDYPDLYKRIYDRNPAPPGKTVEQGRLDKLQSLGLFEAFVTRITAEEWLERRNLKGTDASLLSRFFAENTGPAIGVLILDGHDDTPAVERTIQSLLPGNTGYHAVQIAVVRKEGQELPKAGELRARVLSIDDQGEARALNDAAALLRCDWVIKVNAGDQFTSSGLRMLAQGLATVLHDANAVFPDIVMRRPGAGLTALLRPAFNLDLLLSSPSSMGTHWVFRYTSFEELGGFSPDLRESYELDLILRLVDQTGANGIAHCDEPLVISQAQELSTRQEDIDCILRHLRDRGYQEASVNPTLPGCYRVDYGHGYAPGVSIIIVADGEGALLQRCVESILEKTAYTNYEILIVAGRGDDIGSREWLLGIESLQSMQLRVIWHDGGAGKAAMTNVAAGHARGDYLLVLDQAAAIPDSNWLSAMLNHALRPEVAVVGPKLVRADGRVASAGMVLGVNGVASHAFAGERLDAPGHLYRLQLDQDYSAVSGSCMMVRKSVFEELGGLDESIAADLYEDVDFCLRARQVGYLTVWTPHATVLHTPSAPAGSATDANSEDLTRRKNAAQDVVYERWLPVIAHDPAYNRSLSISGAPFQLEADTTFGTPSLPWRPVPVGLVIPADPYGSGHYRVMLPSKAMRAHGLADARVSFRYPGPVELERLSPDFAILQRQMVWSRMEPQKRLARFSRCFKVAELDDYLPNLPLKSAHKKDFPSDVMRSMRAALKIADRFVVSTDALADALQGFHPDIRVVQNRLPLEWWAHLRPERRTGKRPRVGWAGGSSHRGDLEMVADVVEALADEVEWVFFGMCPDRLRPFVHEFHNGVQIEKYPERLAALNLDVAIAPLEDNLFNRCKSNLRLLEFGACGFPVVCSDITPYRCGLPVTRVKPRFRDWVEAIRMHIDDLEAAARAGDALREAVHRDWMLDAAAARDWLANWLPD